MKNILFWCALPLALPQALWVKKTALRLPDASGETQGTIAVGKQPTLNVIGIGDSVIVGVGVAQLKNALVAQTAAHIAQQYTQNITWQVLGRNGATSQNILDEILPKLPQKQADYFIISVGVNDVTALTRIKRWEENMRAMITYLHQHSANATIVIAGVPPMGEFPLLPQPLRALLGYRASTLDKSAQSITQHFPFVTYIPLDFDLQPQNIAIDGFHPSEQACNLFGKVISAQITQRDRTVRSQ